MTDIVKILTLFDFQLDAQNSYLFTYNTFIKILYMFRALPGSSSGSLRHNCIYAASGIVTVCRWLSCALVNWCLQRVMIPEVTYIQLWRRPAYDHTEYRRRYGQYIPQWDNYIPVFHRQLPTDIIWRNPGLSTETEKITRTLLALSRSIKPNLTSLHYEYVPTYCSLFIVNS
jgi:hypothetical protein